MITPRFLTTAGRPGRHRRPNLLVRVWRALTNQRTPDQPTIRLR